MKNEGIPILWIITGLAYIFFGLNSYWIYSQPGVLFLVELPESWLTNWIIIGIIALYIGVRLFRQPQKVIRLMFSFPIWILLLTLMNFIYYK